MKTLPCILVALSSLSLAACVAKLPGGLSFPVVGGTTGTTGTTATGAAATTESAARTIGPARKVKPELVAYYRKLEHRDLYKLLFDSRRDDIYEKAKNDVGRDLLWQSGNPDPAWIKVWNTKDWTYASSNAEALTQAAFNRTWEDACKAEFAKTRAAHATLAQQFAPELAAVEGQSNHYARRAGYAALATRYEQAAAAAGVDVRKDPFGPAGYRLTILQAALAYHQGSREAYASFPWSDYPLTREMREQGRPISDDAAFELQAYCGRAADRGGLTVTSFGSLWGGGHMSERSVAWPTVWGDQKAIATQVKGQIADAGKTLTARDGLRIATISDHGGLDYADEEPRLAAVSDATITAVKPAGAGATVALTRTRSSSFSYACRETRQIDRIDDNGRIVYRTNCKFGTTTYTLKVTATFAELPPGLTLAKGDVIAFTADVDKDASKKVKNTAAKVDWVRTTTLTGRVLGEVKRGGQTVPF